MEQSIQDNGEAILDMVMGFKSGLMELSIKENGNIIKPMEMVHSYMQMVMFMKGNGKTIWLMVMEYINTLRDQNMKEIGLTINKMVLVLNAGLMVLFMKEIITILISKEKENTFGTQDRFIQGNGFKIKYLDMDV